MMEQNLDQVKPATPEVVTARVEMAFACGRMYVLPYWTDDAILQHDRTCLACRVIDGRSNVHVMSQDDVAALWKVGIDDRRSSTGHYYSSEGRLVHYSTLEAVRLNDGKTVASTCCWSAGFAHCSVRGADYRLPLHTIEAALRGDTFDRVDLRRIVVLDSREGERWTDTVLFRYERRYFLY